MKIHTDRDNTMKTKTNRFISMIPEYEITADGIHHRNPEALPGRIK